MTTGFVTSTFPPLTDYWNCKCKRLSEAKANNTWQQSIKVNDCDKPRDETEHDEKR